MKIGGFLYTFILLLASLHVYSTDLQKNLDPMEKLEIKALFKAYGDLIDGIELRGDEIVFKIHGKNIYYKDGKMLSEKNFERSANFDSIFYTYRKGPLTGTFEPVPYPIHRSSDFLDALLGATEREIREASRWVRFLGHRVFIHEICIEPLKRIDRQIKEHASVSKEVRDFISDTVVMYSMKRRLVSGTNNMSYHSYGLAIDIIPRSYKGKHVYWKWSSVWDEDWGYISSSDRWQPPQTVIDAFEAHGFIWGGKWHHFDNVHFEYRPEIIYIAENISE